MRSAYKESLISAARSVEAGLKTALALVYPEACQLCGERPAPPNQSFVCDQCREQVRFVTAPFCNRCGLPFPGAITGPFECSNCRDGDWSFSKARSVVWARDPILEIIHRYKYRHALWFEKLLAELLIQGASPELSAPDWDWIVPVPLHATKLREREFNQAERLARKLSRAVGIPLNRRLVRRVVATQTQTVLSREERRMNVRRAFAPRKNTVLKGERIVLIDDVFTTGATTDACAKVLRSMGAGEVCVWTVARGV